VTCSGIVLVELISGLSSCQLERYPGSSFTFDEKQFLSLVPKNCPPDFAQIAIDCCKSQPLERPSLKNILERLKQIRLKCLILGIE
jgi:LIM domain kinase 1